MLDRHLVSFDTRRMKIIYQFLLSYLLFFMDKFFFHDPYKKFKCTLGDFWEVQEAWRGAWSPFHGNNMSGNTPERHCQSATMLFHLLSSLKIGGLLY